jgi:hypothetical protein
MLKAENNELGYWVNGLLGNCLPPLTEFFSQITYIL